MTREEAYQKFSEWCNLGFGYSTMPGSEVLVMAMKYLRPTTREQAAKWDGQLEVSVRVQDQILGRLASDPYPSPRDRRIYDLVERHGAD